MKKKKIGYFMDKYCINITNEVIGYLDENKVP